MKKDKSKKPSSWREILILVFLIGSVLCLFYRQLTVSPFPYKIKGYQNIYSTPSAPSASGKTEEGLKKDYKPINFELLSSFDYLVSELRSAGHPLPKGDTRDKIPESVQALNEKDVAITGFLMPTDSDDEGKFQTFLMLKAIPGCMFCQIPRVNEWIDVRFDAKRAVFFRPDEPVTVYGRLQVGEERKDGAFMSFYRLKADSLKAFKQ